MADDAPLQMHRRHSIGASILISLPLPNECGRPGQNEPARRTARVLLLLPPSGRRSGRGVVLRVSGAPPKQMRQLPRLPSPPPPPPAERDSKQKSLFFFFLFIQDSRPIQDS